MASTLLPGPDAWRSWLGLSVLVVMADQVVKYLITVLMPLGTIIPVTPFFNMVHVRNPGAAFSFLADADGWQRYAFTVLGLAVSAVLIGLLRRGTENRSEALAYALIIGGAMGNVLDRIARGAVVDYLDFHWLGWHCPAFNIADISLTLAALLLIVAACSMSRESPDQPIPFPKNRR
ncbi:MAG: signal peptidase II [Burkholderiales bacterium]|nr:signal peptidase II [Burkholderiales bacterium]